MACVKLIPGQLPGEKELFRPNLLRIQIKMCSVDLIESPKKVLGSTIDVGATTVVREVVLQRRFGKLFLEQINFVEEEDNASSHKPA